MEYNDKKNEGKIAALREAAQKSHKSRTFTKT